MTIELLDDAAAVPASPPALSPRPVDAPVELAIIVPTFNEVSNVEPLIACVTDALRGIEWEIIYVDDDSPDGTAEKVRELAQSNRRIRCLRRIGRRGLSSAAIEGMLATSAPYLAVMDGDLQHDEQLLPRMLGALRTEAVDLVIGTRYADGGGLGDGFSSGRARVSALGTKLARAICRVDISDPMSGYFMIRRGAFEHTVRLLSGEGFKILLDILASSPSQLRVRELPFEFRKRHAGESKLDLMVLWEFGLLLADKMVGHIVPVRFALFGIIGMLGLVVHLTVLRIGLAAHMHFEWIQAIATLMAMTFNFFMNNLFTYRDRRLRGWRAARGLLSFYAVCGLGAVANVGIATYVYNHDRAWWVAGVAGVIVGSVWNYATSSVMTWRR